MPLARPIAASSRQLPVPRSLLLAVPALVLAVLMSLPPSSSGPARAYWRLGRLAGVHPMGHIEDRARDQPRVDPHRIQSRSP
jgi:hypothetical protein